HHLCCFFARPRPFLPGDFVTTDQGTGLVHMAPDHGEDDFALCKAHGLDPVFAVEPDGRYRADWPWLGGQGSVINPKFNAPEGPICEDLRRAGALLAASQDYRHSYPHSWRSKARLIYRATPQWFIAIDRPLEPDGLTLRQRALAAIEATRFVPERGRNRIRSMVEGRPDWLISRQRAWGVPITLFVNRRTGEYLRDPDVDARIVAAVAQGGADAWFDADAQALLGNAYSAEEWERVTDILDVWFDSGSTHAFVLGPRHGVAQADLYLEGSDQHRGWFQSSLLECVGTRGHAPYRAVMTHGFTLDGEGRKMSKSLGNVVDPLKVIETAGADVLRLWVAASGYFDDVRIGKEVLAGTSEQYRKLRNTLRYLLGALDGWDEAERVAPALMPELERWVLHRLAELSERLRNAAEGFDFTDYISALSSFANSDLSAFWFDVRKDSLYCDAPDSLRRRAVRTVMDTLFHALVRWLSPILVFTAEEAWTTRYPDAGSVHLLDWPAIDPAWRDEALGERFARLRALRALVTEAIEPLRRDKTLGSSNEAAVRLAVPADDLALLQSVDFAELAIVAQVELVEAAEACASAGRTAHARCERCWRHLPEVGTLADPHLCGRCHEVVHPQGDPATAPVPAL
ncbi:MAG: isoleucine--tRNA ligase, partial [Sphingomonadaceae bacterium]